MLGLSLQAMADPIDDVLDILEQMEKMQAQMGVDTSNISSNTMNQLNEVKSEWEKLTQSYGMADTKADQNARLWSADDWNAVLQQASGGNNARLQELMQSYSALYPILKTEQGGTINPDKLVSTNYTQKGQTYNAALSTSAYTYDDINNQIGKVETLLADVDNTGKNQNEKAAMDLNSRLVAELAFIQLQMLKLQSIHTQMEATKNQSEFNEDTLDKQFTEYQLTN